MNKLKAILTIGCSGSGKSTWAIEQCKKYNWIRIERDIIREFLLVTELNAPKSTVQFICADNIWKHWKFNRKHEDLVTKQVNDEIARAHRNNFNIIISDTNLHTGRRMEMKRKLEELGYDVEFKVFGEDLSLEELWKRDTYRKNTVGHSVIAKQHEQFRKEFPKYQLKDVTDKPNAILCDLDGTFFNMGDRSPFAWNEVNKDTVNDVVMQSLSGLSSAGYKIIFLSGRDESCYDMSKNMILDAFSNTLDGYLCHPTHFTMYMRKSGDMRKDTIIKEELFFEHIDGEYKVAGVFDDRPVVVRLWQEFGFNTYAVGNQYNEF